MKTTIRNEKLFCLNCGGYFTLSYPVPLDTMKEIITAFEMLHHNCKPTWKEPEVDKSKSVTDRANSWIANGETGLSSRAMWRCFMAERPSIISHPLDPDDFSRCYKLLEAVPEWKVRLNELKTLSKEWSNLVDNWSELEKMFLEKDKKMYAFMKDLISS